MRGNHMQISHVRAPTSNRLQSEFSSGMWRCPLWCWAFIYYFLTVVVVVSNQPTDSFSVCLWADFSGFNFPPTNRWLKDRERPHLVEYYHYKPLLKRSPYGDKTGPNNYINTSRNKQCTSKWVKKTTLFRRKLHDCEISPSFCYYSCLFSIKTGHVIRIRN